jgi:hypothetical protein
MWLQGIEQGFHLGVGHATGAALLCVFAKAGSGGATTRRGKDRCGYWIRRQGLE